jgi:hypothetical protein
MLRKGATLGGNPFGSIDRRKYQPVPQQSRFIFDPKGTFRLSG